jgi:hypothetical protein
VASHHTAAGSRGRARILGSTRRARDARLERRAAEAGAAGTASYTGPAFPLTMVVGDVAGRVAAPGVG